MVATLVLVVAIGSTLMAAYFQKQEGIQRGLVGEKTKLAQKNARLVGEKESALEAELEAGRQRDISLGREKQAREEAERQKSFARHSLYTSSLFTAQHSLATEDGYSRARELLAEMRPQAGEEDMRGWEWYYLHAQRPSGSLILEDFSKYPIAVAFSPDGKLLATGDASGKVKLFDANSGRLKQTLRVIRNRFHC